MSTDTIALDGIAHHLGVRFHAWFDRNRVVVSPGMGAHETGEWMALVYDLTHAPCALDDRRDAHTHTEEEIRVTHPTAHDGYDYDIPESAQGHWEIDDHGIPTFVPVGVDPAADALVAEQALEDDAATQAFLRGFGLGSWLTRMDRRLPVRIVGGSPA